ncbi:acyl carrier protein phosphodiesterase [Chitinophaga japonensis]|uniref:Acyl carrier protein phosphodiesterase n=1 Tax=Chitinophaga japonensis TaxID=104662 RepID=A0A562TD77_CHIJA|nr:ACP phosphodiesterase [Chitinophaga japonensis]TWI91462.1 acyl carrier protein phosphodiesterase [Chitinophaga japonensis]
MNFLAHAYLSYNDPSLTIGNMIADFVKGKQLLQYGEDIQQGIRIHRAIDAFTDEHPLTRAATRLFQASCGRYGAVFIDVAYDHFLARDETRFTDEQLGHFAQSVYRLLENRKSELPTDFLQVFHFMRTQNWLYNYRTEEGIYRSFSGLVRRARYLDVSADVPFAVLENHYKELAEYYAAFFPELETFVKTAIKAGG